MPNWLEEILNHPSVSIWASWVSFASLLAVLYNSWRLSKIARFIEIEREKVVDTIKPFDLYLKIREAAEQLPQQANYHSGTLEDRINSQAILDGLNASAECLRLYFRDIYGLVIQRDNIFLDAAHVYLNKNQPDRALEYYRKARTRAKRDLNEAENIECLYGMRNCFARQGNRANTTAIDRELRRLHNNSAGMSIKEHTHGFIAMLVIKGQVLLRPLRAHRKKQDPLPDNWALLHGDLQDLFAADEGKRGDPASHSIPTRGDDIL